MLPFKESQMCIEVRTKILNIDTDIDAGESKIETEIIEIIDKALEDVAGKMLRMEFLSYLNSLISTLLLGAVDLINKGKMSFAQLDICKKTRLILKNMLP